MLQNDILPLMQEFHEYQYAIKAAADKAREDWFLRWLTKQSLQ